MRTHPPMSTKTLSVGIPCYNSAEYMDHAISSILEGAHFSDDIQVIIVDDGSTKDDTFAKAKAWEARYPDLVKAIHQENGGHGIAVLTALEAADGVYFKVCDSDDWYDGDALDSLMKTLRSFIDYDVRVDLVVTNYVYEHVEDGKQNVIDYRFALRRNKVLTWEKIGHFGYDQNLLMHALCYRTDILRDGGIPMPAHTFYVDNIYAYVPLPRCKTLYYLDVDLYRYFIGREDQSVNEKVMAGRIDQQLRVTRIMMDAYHLYDDVESTKLRTYMLDYMNLMMAVCSIFARLSDVPNARLNCNALWEYFKQYDKRMYNYCRKGLIGIGANLPTKMGEKTSIGLYRIIQKVVKFN